ncbi:MAG TPA: trigger factor [Bacillota bacterium]|nr:trigger factor [Bacillota bacterium]HOH10117.1 trigger factor [Bacillota bacterium]HOS50458.1 trigger factor [Bacillota bacterium]HPI01117.1 trigger factor [Bacillota bacterium]HPM64061.1 trigger factor [Bacillota bacterium]
MLKVNFVGKAASVATIEVVIDHEAAVKAIDDATLSLGRRVRIPGFRQGKAPKAMVERYAGKPSILQEALEDLVTSSYRQAVKDNDLKPIADPEFEGLDKVDLGSGKEESFKMMIMVEPEVKLPDYKGFKMDKTIKPVTDEDVDKELDGYREQVAQYIPSNRDKVEDGDMVTIDFKGLLNEGTPEEEAFEGGTAENVDLLIGSGQFIPGFEEQLVGAAKGADVDVKVSFPENYGAEHLAGKAATFKCKVREIKDKIVPEKDDEFAKKLGFEKLDELKGALKHGMEHRNYDSAVRALGVEALNKLTDGAEVELPAAMVEDEAADMLNDLARRVEEQGLKWDEYLKSRSTTQDAMLEDMRPRAEAAVKQHLAVRELLASNNLRVTAAEVDRAIEMMAGRPGETKPADVKKLKENDRVRSSVGRLVAQDKAIRLLSGLCDADPEAGKCKQHHDHGHEEHEEHEGHVEEAKENAGDEVADKE